AVPREDPRCPRFLRLDDAQEKVLGGDVLVLEVLRRFEGGIEHFPQRRRDERLRGFTANLGELRNLRGHLGFDRGRIESELVEDRSNDSSLLAQQRHEQMLRRDLRVSSAAGEVLRFDARFLRLARKLVEIHTITSYLSQLGYGFYP